ncbi:uncharacterized protein [Parasteatoda tepidariorum]|uniref:uncharacterized protein n=1 Tax=Parasteatoda tepidariorum TaxID=114398 RepID=UPI001C71C148|nr:uncharacterized protein LOC107443365 [Parasteatoda tepidariorum]
MGQMMALTVLLMLISIKYAVVEGTFGLYSQPLNAYHSSQLKSPFSWLGLSTINSFPSSYSSVYDTLNSEYSHALYPFPSDYVARIPVKGGLHVVPAPKNLHLLKGIHSYDHHSLYQNIHTPKRLSLTSLIGNDYQDNFKGSSSPLLPHNYKNSISGLINLGGLDLADISLGRTANGYSSGKNLHSTFHSAKEVSHNFKPFLDSYHKHTSSAISENLAPAYHDDGFRSQFKSETALRGHNLPHNIDYSKSKVQQERDPSIYSNQNIGVPLHQSNKVHNSLETVHPAIHTGNIHHIQELQQKKVGHADELQQTHISQLPETDKAVTHEHPKTSHNNGYLAQKPILDNSHHFKNDNYDKKVITVSRVQGEYKRFPNPPNYIHRRKPQSKTHFHKETNNAFQTKKYENPFPQNKEYQKPLEQTHTTFQSKEHESSFHQNKEYEKPVGQYHNTFQTKQYENPFHQNKEYVKPLEHHSNAYHAKRFENPLHQNKESKKPLEQHHHAFQAKVYENPFHQSKEYEKPLEQHHEEYPIKEVSQYPEFPKQTKSSDTTKEINYSGGRYPIRTPQQHHDQNSYTSERPLVDRNHGLKIPFNSRKVYEHTEQAKLNEEDTLYDLKNKKSGYENSASHQVSHVPNYGVARRPNGDLGYKSKSVPPRGRSKQYRNYEEPRSSSYEIEILHSENSDQTKQISDDGRLEVADSVETVDTQEPFDDEPEEFDDDTDNFETQESRENIFEEAKDSGEKPESEVELVSEEDL